MDGVSFSNAGFKIVSHAEVNVQAEAIAKTEAETDIKKLDKADETKADPNDEENEDGDLQGRDSSDNEDEETDPEQLEEVISKKKKFRVKFNASTEMIEMLDSITGNIIETVSPEDLINLLSKTKVFSGVFVDRKI